MYVGALELDVLLGDVHSLKEKRSVVRPVVAELRKRSSRCRSPRPVTWTCTGASLIGVAVVAADAGACQGRAGRL